MVDNPPERLGRGPTVGHATDDFYGFRIIELFDDSFRWLIIIRNN